MDIRSLFPALSQKVYGKDLIYLDSAATTLKPQSVIDRLSQFYSFEASNVHRGAHYLSDRATESFEAARKGVASFLNAKSAEEIIFVRGTTEGINLVANSWGVTNLQPGDQILVTEMEHHANIVPWHMLVQSHGIQLRWVPLTSDGQLDLTNLDELLKGAKIFSFTAMSNVLGTLTPVKQLCAAAHAAGAIAIVDGCQYVPHNVTDVVAWDADFLTFSSHKMCGPSGIGVLWGREALLNAMPPFLGGGNMIGDVRLDGFTCAELPAKFEAGTPPITEVIGLGAAISYLTDIGMDNIRQHEKETITYALSALNERYGKDITIHGPTDPEVRGTALSFKFKDVHPHDLSQVLDQSNICVRAGHHCAKPLMRLLGANATARASFYLYNSLDDVDALVNALEGAGDLFSL